MEKNIFSIEEFKQLTIPSFDLSKFKWKDRDDNFHYPKNMETRHLFFTLRMIWNHSVPEEYKIRPYKEYVFSKFYTVKYMKEAVYCLTKELSTRSDLTLYYKKCLKHIHECLKEFSTEKLGLDKL